MTDPVTMLRAQQQRSEPDPAFRVRLMNILDDAIEGRTGASAPKSAPPPTLTGAIDLPDGGRAEKLWRSRLPAIVLSAAAVVVAVVAAVVLVRERDTPSFPGQDSPAPTAPVTPSTTTPPTTTTAPTTTFAPTTTAEVVLDPVVNAAIAESVLLDADDFALGWKVMQFKQVVLDRALAATVPGCASSLDAVFESPERRAVTSYRHFSSPLPAILRQYVVVFPSELAAKAMFDATVDPDFNTECFRPYYELTDEFTGNWCCDINDPSTPPLYGRPIESERDHDADDFSLRLDDTQYWTGADGVLHGPETLRSTTIRVGRTIIIMESIILDEFGNSIVSADEFHDAIATAIAHARSALETTQS